MSMVSTQLHTRIVDILCASAEGDLTKTMLAEADGSLPAVGYSSLATIRMIDTIENEFGVYIDPDESRLHSVAGITELVAERLADASAG